MPPRFSNLITGLLLAMAFTVAAKADPPSSDQLMAWIQQLGASRFIAREVATRELLDAGPSALPLLNQSVKSPHREIRDRVRRIISILHERQREEKLADFRLGNCDLPGWKQFVAHQYGDVVAGREIFADIVEAEWILFGKVYNESDPPVSVRALVTDRLYRVNQQPYKDQRLGTQLGLLVIANDFPDEVTHDQLHGLTRHPTVQPLLAGQEKAARSEIVREIVGTWLLVASSGGVNQQNYLNTAMRFRLPHGKALASRVLENKSTLPLAKNYAMQTLALFGDASSAPLMETFLDDKTPMGKTGGRERQLRDIALACLMVVRKQDLAEIGIRRGSGTQLFDYRSLGYANESDRQAALRYYRSVKAQGFPPKSPELP